MCDDVAALDAGAALRLVLDVALIIVSTVVDVLVALAPRSRNLMVSAPPDSNVSSFSLSLRERWAYSVMLIWSPSCGLIVILPAIQSILIELIFDVPTLYTPTMLFSR